MKLIPDTKKNKPTNVFRSKVIKKNATWKYFNHCLICKAMQNADKRGKNLSETELRTAFQKANER